MKQTKLLLESIKRKIDKAKVVSFDIFDTLLLRPYVRPVDLFTHIEKAEKKPFFLQLRQEAEREARRKHATSEDVTFDEIYDEIDDNVKYLKVIEQNFEKMVLTPNPELKQVYDYALEKNKRIVIASDMYLPSDFLSDTLKENGFTSFEKIYVSGDIGKTKHTGNLYKHIIADMNISNAEDILHIGDNKHSDYKKAKKAGINAVLYEQVIKQFLRNNPRISKFLKQNKGKIGASILTAFMAIRWQNKRCGTAGKNSYWENLGYEYAGPVAYGYSRFVEKEAIKNNIDTLFFVARDGYTLQKVFNTFSSNISNSYVYAPRFLNLICRLDYDRHNIKQSQAIIDYYSNQNNEIKQAYAKTNKHDAKSNHKFIQDNLSLFTPLATKNHDNYKKYLSGILKRSEKVGVVDTITAEFSSQKLLQHSLDNFTYGFYWGILKSNVSNSFEYSVFKENNGEIPDGRDVFTANWNFIETLITSPEYPIKNMTPDGKPIYDPTPSEAERCRAQIYPEIYQSAVLFAEDIKSKFNGYDIHLENDIIIDWINSYIDNPLSQDIDYMSEIRFGCDSGHTEYIPLFVEKISFKDFIKHPLKTIKRIGRNKWKTLPQKILLCIFKPFSIKTRGLKQFQLSVLPALSRRYLVASLSINEKCFYSFFIGNNRK